MPHTVRMYDERVAISSLESLAWPNGPVCPHCGEAARLGRLNGLSTAVGVWKCYACRKPFTVRHGTVFHNSHVPMHVWLQALYLLMATDQRMGSQKLSQILGVSVRTAWHLKVKIAAGLDLAPGDHYKGGLGQDVGDQVIRCRPAQDAAPQPTGTARYERFLAAIEGHASETVDRHFLQALSRLLVPQPGTQLTPPDVCEEQLELGLFSDGDVQMSAGRAERKD